MSRILWLTAGASLAAFALTGAALAAEAKPEKQQRSVQILRGEGPHVAVVRRGGRDRAEHLRAILQLRPNQEAALQSYLEALKPKRDRLIRFDAEAERKPTPQRLAEIEARRAEREADFKARIEATRRFYDQLDPAQKRAFDELPLTIENGFGPLPIGPMPIMHHLPLDLEEVIREKWTRPLPEVLEP